MSLTILLLVGMIVGVILAIVFGAVALDAEKGKCLEFAATVLCGLFIAASIGSLIGSIASYNTNVRESRQSCLDRGGYIYEKDQFKACFDKAPVELQRL